MNLENNDEINRHTGSNLFHYIIVIASLIMFAYVPTSKNRVMIDLKSIIILWAIALIIILVFLLNNYLSKNSIFISFFLLSYMSIVTYIALNQNEEIRFSVARLTPVLSIILISTVVLKKSIPFGFMGKILDFFMITMIILNTGVILKIGLIQQFIINNYTQFHEAAVPAQVFKQNPVMSFGVHSFASFFYMIIFLLCYFTLKKNFRNKKFYFYIFVLFVFNMLLKSTTSLIFSIIMLVLIFKLISNVYFKSIIITSTIFILIFLIPAFLIEGYQSNLSSDMHGFIPRYFSEIYSDNFEFLSNNILGLGFNISDKYNIYYTDSGYIVYFTMGNIIFVIGIYYLLYKLLKNNLKIEYKRYLFAMIMLFEFAIPNVIYFKFFFLLIFTLYYLKSLDNIMHSSKYD